MEPADSSHQEQELTLLEESLEEFKQAKIFKWFDYMLGSKYGLYILPVIVIIDVYLLILPLEPILAVYAIKHKQTKLWVISAVSTGVSLIGYATLYMVGEYASGGTVELLQRIFGEEQIIRAGELFGTNMEFGGIIIGISALLSLASALASVPIPLSVLTFSAGVFGVAFIPFAIMFTIGRYIRYYAAAWIGRRLGVPALEAAFKNVYLFTFLTLLSITIILFKVF